MRAESIRQQTGWSSGSHKHLIETMNTGPIPITMAAGNNYIYKKHGKQRAENQTVRSGLFPCFFLNGSAVFHKTAFISGIFGRIAVN